MTDPGNLIMLSRSPKWPAAIRRQKWPIRISWALDIEDVISEAAVRPGSVVVVEVSGEQIADQIDRLAQLTNSPYHLTLLAVGNYSLARWRKLLITLGFADVFWSTTQVNRLGNFAVRHIANTRQMPQTVEDRVWAELPWKPVNNI